MADLPLTRRDLLALLAAAAAARLVPACAHPKTTVTATPGAPGDAAALALLDRIAEDYLRLFPERATSLGVDTGARAEAKSGP